MSSSSSAQARQTTGLPAAGSMNLSASFAAHLKTLERKLPLRLPGLDFDGVPPGGDYIQFVAFLESELIDQPGEVTSLIRILVRAVGRPRALAVAADVHRDEPDSIREAPGERVERLRAARIAVNADHGRRAGSAPLQIA